MAKSVSGRAVHGIVLLDKPSGISSNAALQRVKKLFQAQKAGHTGSLDPLASGLLPVCLGEATKISAFLLDADKRYEADCRLGVTTTTADAEGEILQVRQPNNISRERVVQVLSQFFGPIQQVPPMYSALKQGGETLYKLARQGKIVDRPARNITIHSLTLTGLHDNLLSFSVHCSKGTYIRTLAEDIGEQLGCGAHIVRLHRTATGPFQDMVEMETLADAVSREGVAALDQWLLPPQAALPHLPDIILDDEQCRQIQYGQQIQYDTATISGQVKLFDAQQRFIGIGDCCAGGLLSPQRLFNL